MFGTLVEVEGAGERRWGRLAGARRGPMGRLRGFSGRPLRGFGYSFSWETEPTDYVSMPGTDAQPGAAPGVVSAGTAAAPDYLTAVLDTLKAVAPGVLGVVQAAVNRGVAGQAGSCPPGYSFWSPITGRCFRTAQEMGAADAAVQQAQSQYGGGSNTMLLVGAGLLGAVGLFLALKK